MRVEPSGSRPCSSKRPSRIGTWKSPRQDGLNGSMRSVVRTKPSVIVSPPGPSTRPLIVTPGFRAAATSWGGSPALTS